MLLMVFAPALAAPVSDLTELFDQIMGGFQSIRSCDTNDEWTDENIGTLESDPDKYCSSCYRQLLCCRPQQPTDMLQFELWIGGQKVSDIAWNDATVTGLGQCTGITYVIHGWLEDQFVSPYLVNMTRLLSFEQCTIMVDWSRGNRFNYFQAIANVRTVGTVIGYHASQVIARFPATRIKLVGFSLGGQTIGEAARYYTARTMGRKFNTCHGLDIAGPMYDGCDDGIRLTADLCDDVQVVHTDAMTSNEMPFVTGFGSAFSSGKVDYWINCGRDQGGTCVTGIAKNTAGLLVPLMAGTQTGARSNSVIGDDALYVLCNHFRAALVYVSQLMGKCIFMASSCPDCASQCTKPIDSSGATVPFMQATIAGDYKLQTSDNGDFCPSR